MKQNGIYTLLETAEKQCYWGVDTSLIWLNKKKFQSGYGRLDQISTSWDDVPQMPHFQRYGGDKYRMFEEHFAFVMAHMPQIVVHTLFSKKNKDYLKQIADELLKRKVRTWSLYQFWPFDFIQNTGDYCVETGVFEQQGREMAQYIAGRMDFEYVPYMNRANGYFFVSSKGKVYTTLSGSLGKYKVLGSIFDGDIYEKWHEWSNPGAAEEILERKIMRETAGGKQ